MATKVFVLLSSGDREVALEVGLRYPLNAAIRGWMDEVALYNTALPADRISAHYTAGNTFVPPDGGTPVGPVLDNPQYDAGTGELTVTWTGGGELQSATSLTGDAGDWAGTGNSTGTYTETITGGSKYFRVVLP